jgi:hypothetical protein
MLFMTDSGFERRMPQVENIQLVLFSQSPIPKAHQVAAGQGFGDFEFVSAQTIDPNVSVAGLAVGGYSVQLQSSPGRLDVIVGSKSPTGPGSFESLINIDDALKEIRTAFDSALSLFAAHRVACVINAFDQANLQRDALDQARSELGGVIVPNGATEFDYKINMPTNSEEQEGLQINRLYRWYSVGLIQMMFFTGPDGFSGQNTGAISWRFSHQIDISTDVDGKLDPAVAPAVMSEVISEAKRLLSNGRRAFDALN